MEETGSALGSPLGRRALLTGAAGMAGALGLGFATALPAAAARQTDWRWCNRCQCLFYAGNYTTGWCTQGGGHDYRDSYRYRCNYGSGSQGHSRWRWCNKCQSLFYGGTSSRGRCPAGGGHDWEGSYNYFIEYGNSDDDDEQEGWRWCNKCYCMCFSGNGNGRCPSGGRHNFRGSYHYYFSYQN